MKMPWSRRSPNRRQSNAQKGAMLYSTALLAVMLGFDPAEAAETTSQ
jgi:hypothetical protein